ncbi:MAG: hypothetical protein HN348_16690 [Proteobacteria bacterium]|jgi:hypothetical protein|nr:hypothetical protein [Pseudomonadota bacterium]
MPFITTLFLILVSVTWAKPDDDDLFDDDLFEDEEEPAPPAEEDDEEDQDLDDIDDDDLDFFDEEDVEDSDLLGDEEPVELLQGRDTAAIYRAQQNRVAKSPTDEKISAWEAYLAEYPNSTFRDRIEKTLEELMNQLYETPMAVSRVDANKAEVKFATPLLLESINPRTRLLVGFEWGLPDFINLMLDYEHAIIRTFSFHAGLRHRYTGYSIEPGVRWAVIKSAKSHTILTVIGDVHFNAAPFFVGLRPQLAFGKRFGKKIDLQLQAGVDVEARKYAGLRLIGGANVTYMASKDVWIFVESSINMKNFDWAGGPFRFNVLNFGMQFFPAGKKMEKDKLNVNVGASVPYSTNYWQHHFGSVSGQVNYFL